MAKKDNKNNGVKRCMLFETLGKVSDLQVQESRNPSEGVRLSGIFGVCGVKNQNNRIYDKQNYAQMVESLQKVIATEGCPGELEHPNNFNINLENVSHKIESIEMNEDGTITGTILLLNTPKGKIAQAIVEGGLPLYISSRGAGTITNEGRVCLTSLKTYDLVGTPGFSQAKLTLKENQTVESLNESVEDGNVMWAIVEGEEVIDIDDNKEKKSEKHDKHNDDDSSEEKHEVKKEKEEEPEEPKKEPKKENNKDNDKDNVTMEEIKKAIDALTDKVTTLEAELHVAQESAQPNYRAVEKWITEEFAPHFQDKIVSNVTKGVEYWVNEELKGEFMNSVQNYINENLSKNIQTWVVEEFGSKINDWVEEEVSESIKNDIKDYIDNDFSECLESWVVNEFAGEVNNWVTEEFAGAVEGWITEEFADTLGNWINEEFSPEIENKVNENVSNYLSENNNARLDEIDSLLETISDEKNSTVKEIVKEAKVADKFANVYAVKNMPAEYIPSWNMLDEGRQEEIVRTSRMYDFTKEGILESFWAGVDFNKKEEKPIEESKDILNDYHSNVFNQMMRLRK